MKIEYDPKKSQRNIEERGLSFEERGLSFEERGLSFDEAAFFEWQTTEIVPDVRFDYPEPRFTATGYLGERLHILYFTPVQNGVRVISFRKANKREMKKYETEKTTY
ncbi:hypothetical protein BKK52_11870 [Rodentibacter trehalosifermentans]|uniref:Toxin n=1 Tax=Rodentibacter trehalosifermentans TaxID=1908263 RepID=A0A1V3IVS4_9PAST|nr:BrnT family toxin [Rodentibacter trehalosifermentans]OOF46017.1 hypothetical protein BKK52_11870 [Rodentibacter trehalosifermentans]